MAPDQTDDLAAELDAFLSDDSFPLPDEDDFVPVAVPDEQTVNRMLRRRARLTDERDRISDAARAEIERITEWASDRRSGVERQLVWLERGLEMFMRQHNEATGRKSLPLPNGTLRLTQPGAPSVVVVDESEFVTWCLLEDERDRFLRRTVAADKTEVRRELKVGPEDEPGVLDSEGVFETSVFFAVDADGAVVPGLRFQKPAQPRFTVTPPTDNQGSPDKETTQ